jgi:hypothetical protein
VGRRSGKGAGTLRLARRYRGKAFQLRRPLLSVLLVLAVAASLAVAPALAGAAVPPVTFAEPTTVHVPFSAESIQGSIATADFNRDGHADVAAYSSNYLTEAHSLEVWISSAGAGPTTWGWTTLTSPAVPSLEAGFVATGQMNPETDSNPDLVALSISGEEGKSKLGVFLGTGIGTFSQAVETLLPGYPNARPTIADVNGDDIPDVLIPTLTEKSGGTWESEVVTLIGEGDGHFEAPIVSPVASGASSADVYATGIAVGEFTGGGHIDLAVSQGYNPAKDVYVMAGNGAGEFTVAESLALGAGSTGVVSGDFDGDGHADLAAPIGVPDSARPGHDSGERVATALGDGAGSFTALTPQTPEWQAENPYSYGIATADLNGDGKPDLLLPIASDPHEGGVWALLGNGDGTFTESSKSELEGGNVWDAQPGDFDGDGHEDVAALIDPTGPGELELAVYDNTSAPSFQPGAAAVDAGTVEVGQAGTTTVPLTNSGNYALSITALTVSGADAAGFTVSGCATIAPETTCDASVTFRPSRIGAEGATLTIATDDPAEPSATVALSGAGAVTTTAPEAGGGGGTGGGGKAQTEPATGTPTGTLKLPRTAAVAKNGKASLALSCSGGPCSGRLALTIATKKKAKGKARTVTTTIGGASYSLAARQSKTIAVKLTGAARKLLAAPGSKLAATLTATSSRGTKSSAKLTLVGASSKRK